LFTLRPWFLVLFGPANACTKLHRFQGGDPLKRNENDAAALQAKVAAKQVQKEAAVANVNNASKGPIVPKKVKKDAGVEDLLLAGLPAPKKKVVSSK
jgi:hypothetical protein